MSLWTLLTGLGLGGMLVLTALIQPSGRGFRARLRAHDPTYLVPTWTFFAPEPGVHDARLIWRERMHNGTAGPWHEVAPPHARLRRAVWYPSKRARKVVLDLAVGITADERPPGETPTALRLPYLVAVAHVLALPSSPLSAARQFAILVTQGADAEEVGCFELQFVSSWHRMPGGEMTADSQAPRDVTYEHA